jgi:hypothetical protein
MLGSSDSLARGAEREIECNEKRTKINFKIFEF